MMGRPISTLLGDTTADKEMKEKMRKYIVENSELRKNLQTQKQQYEEVWNATINLIIDMIIYM